MLFVTCSLLFGNIIVYLYLKIKKKYEIYVCLILQSLETTSIYLFSQFFQLVINFPSINLVSKNTHLHEK